MAAEHGVHRWKEGELATFFCCILLLLGQVVSAGVRVADLGLGLLSGLLVLVEVGQEHSIALAKETDSFEALILGVGFWGS